MQEVRGSIPLSSTDNGSLVERPGFRTLYAWRDCTQNARRLV
jgi:hypothetical protein